MLFDMVIVNDYEAVIDTIEDLVDDDTKFPVVEDGWIKMMLKMILAFTKVVINYLIKSNASKKEE